MAKKASSAAPEWGETLTPESLARYGALDVAFPAGTRAEGGSWSAAWQIWLLRRSTRDTNQRGCIELERSPVDGDGTVALSVRQSLVQPSHRVAHRTRASIRCAADRLCSPVEWSLETSLVSPGGESVYAEASVRARGAVRGGRLEITHGERTSRRELAGAVSSSWSLLEALGRLSGAGDGVIEFTLLDELDKVKPGQRLRFREATTIRFAGEPRRVGCYEHVGRGALPWTYYVDPACGLLLATGGLRAYIRDAEAPKRFAGIVDRSAAGGRGRAGAGGAR